MEFSFFFNITINTILSALALPTFHWVRRWNRRRKLGWFLEKRPLIKVDERGKKVTGKRIFLSYILFLPLGACCA